MWLETSRGHIHIPNGCHYLNFSHSCWYKKLRTYNGKGAPVADVLKTSAIISFHRALLPSLLHFFFFVSLFLLPFWLFLSNLCSKTRYTDLSLCFVLLVVLQLLLGKLILFIYTGDIMLTKKKNVRPGNCAHYCHLRTCRGRVVKHTLFSKILTLADFYYSAMPSYRDNA